MSASALPSKLFFRIGEVAGLVGVEPHVLRYWEREFRSIRPTKSAKGQRVYSRKDVENLLRVRDLLYRDGFTIAGAKKRLQRGVASEPTALLHAADVEGAVDVAEESPGAVVHEARDDHDGAADVELEDDDEQEEIALAEPASGPRSQPRSLPRSRSAAAAARTERDDDTDDDVRAKLTALRVEVEGFLLDLESGEHP